MVRLFITFCLIERKVLITPALYTICFLKRYRIEYYDRMIEVCTKAKGTRYIEANPIIDIHQTAEALNCSSNTLSSAVDRLVEKSIPV